MASTARPTTPLRRISRGSISALSSSRGGPNSSSSSSTPLSFLEGPLGNLADETSILSSNLAELAEIYEALNVFNEGFGGFVYGLKVAAYCIEWAEAPQEENFENAKEREAAFIRDQALLPTTSPYSPAHNTALASGSGTGYNNPADQTYVTQDEISFEAATAPPGRSRTTTPKKNSTPVLKSAMKKGTTSVGAGTTGKTGAGAGATGAAAAGGAVKPKITLAQKKKREKYAEEIIETLPLEYRSNDPAARRLALAVLMALIAAGPHGARMADIVKPPELPQVKVNKCLMALERAKHLVKVSNNGVVYSLDPARHPTLP
ncbi:hypothetical protein BCV69DRAFT_314661 [Microstroma glucosiphilum]|uniref:DASH complex subunit DAM1 n=1 Tax=Pseudomicrostroma glucosiphilum TaxID=1684307 RepID=A0A316TYZ4_9BASI|nr:hypothetical protein BCV69DRAFT_314661 [Pseudomicrostroma glucosiphilum]PWN18466.1 hypothetical protein BCV69DRAFT_314661 [Pseudomicrostroma glucosiphilum]